jgi:hypothetical protein
MVPEQAVALPERTELLPERAAVLPKQLLPERAAVLSEPQWFCRRAGLDIFCLLQVVWVGGRDSFLFFFPCERLTTI